MSPQEQEDVQALINIFFPFAEELLIKFREFHPYAGATTHNGEFVSASQPEPDEKTPAAEVVARIKQTVKESHVLYKLVAIFYEVRTRDADTGQVADAIAVFVEHATGTTAYEFFYPYSFDGPDRFMIHDMYGNQVPKEIFPLEQTAGPGHPKE